MSGESKNSLSAAIQKALASGHLDEVRETVNQAGYQVQRWQALMNQARAAIATIEPESGTFLDYNPRTLELFDFEQARFESLSVSDLIPDDDADWVWREFRSALTEGQVAIAETPLVTGGGRRLYCDVSVSTLQLDDAVLLQAVFRDVTERVELLLASKNHERELLQRNDDLLEARKISSEFLATISHELRTPLNAIIGYNSMLEDGIYGDLSDPQRRSLKKIDVNATHLLSLIEQLLQVSRLEAGVVGVVIEDFNLIESIDSVLAPIRTLFESKEIGLVFDPAYSDLVIRSDEGKVAETLRQFISNALKFTTSGSVTVDLTVEDQSLALSVCDTGPGITDEQKKTIFDLFRQGDSSPTRRPGGAGLGLSVVRRLAKLLKGQIDLESEVGRGTTFTLHLPDVVRYVRSKTEHVLEPKKYATVATSVLVLDNDPYTVELFSEALEEAGCRVRRAYSGMEAMLKMTERQPDLVLIDLLDPSVNGERVLQYGYECWGEGVFKTVVLHEGGLPEDERLGLLERTSLLISKPGLDAKNVLEKLAPVLDLDSITS